MLFQFENFKMLMLRSKSKQPLNRLQKCIVFDSFEVFLIDLPFYFIYKYQYCTSQSTNYYKQL